MGPRGKRLQGQAKESELYCVGSNKGLGLALERGP